MYFISTRGGERVTGAQAIVQGLAKNGGLYVPETFPTITREELESMAEMSYAERAAFVLGKYLAEELGADYLNEVCEKAYSDHVRRSRAPCQSGRRIGLVRVRALPRADVRVQGYGAHGIALPFEKELRILASGMRSRM